MHASVERPAATTPATLRRLDWRFLLTVADRPFDHLVWLGGTPELSQWAMHLGIALRVSLTLPATSAADALVLSHGAEHPTSRAAWCLRPGGSCYYELGRGARSASSCIAGSQVQVYLTAPGAVGPSAYLPIGRGGPATWYARAPVQPLDLRARLYGGAASWFPQTVLARFPVLAPERAVVVAPHSVSARLSSLVGDGQLRWALLTPGTRDRSSVVFLPFARGRAEPLAVFKTVRSPEQTERLQREQSLLHEVRSGLTAELRRSVPEPLGLTQVGSLMLSIQSYCAGRSLAASTGDWATTARRKLADLHLAAGWLTELHHQTQLGRTPWSDESISRWIGEPIHRFETKFGTHVGQQQLFAAARAHAQRLLGTPLPLVRQHNDFDPWNVHRLGDRVGVFDWERSALGPALADLLYFVTIWSSLAHRLNDRGAQARNFERLYLDPVDEDPFVRAGREVIAAYMSRLGIHRAFLPLMLVMTVVERALDRVNGESTTDADPRNGNRHVSYLDVLVRRCDWMFSDSGVWGWAR